VTAKKPPDTEPTRPGIGPLGDDATAEPVVARAETPSTRAPTRPISTRALRVSKATAVDWEKRLERLEKEHDMLLRVYETQGTTIAALFQEVTSFKAQLHSEIVELQRRICTDVEELKQLLLSRA
jgi:predicted RNase H-like nuclease (RuvC/YqgF family)